MEAGLKFPLPVFALRWADFLAFLVTTYILCGAVYSNPEMAAGLHA